MKRVNRQINRLRSVVERTVAPVWTWWLLYFGCQRPLGSSGRVFSSGAGVDFLRGYMPLMNKVRGRGRRTFK